MSVHTTTLSEPEQFAKNKYVFVKKLIPLDICNVATQYALFHLQRFYRPESAKEQVPGTHSVYGDLLMETLLKFSVPHLEKRTGLKLIPTYSYFRVYKPGDVLERHKDRPACEISTTVTLGYHYVGAAPDYHWPIFVGASDGATGTPGKAMVCEPGDCVIYRGCEVEHWRERLDAKDGSFHVQVFLHYVDANGPYAKTQAYDRRPGVGFPSPKET